MGVLRHEIKDRGTKIRLCQFKPDHDLNPETLHRYQKNRLRVVPELSYSPHNPKAGRLDLTLFVNGIPVVTMELKSQFKQRVKEAIKDYKTKRLPKDKQTKKAEPLLTFKRGALVHFAVGQYEVYMTTHLDGENTRFLPFNRGTKEGGAGNDTPEEGYPTAYLWREICHPENLLTILGRYIHLHVEDKEDWEGRRVRNESLIFPRYHQWDVVNRLIDHAKREGPGQKYLIQHSAGSGKSNSIAWAAHQLATLYDEDGNKRFHSVIVITDRTVLDNQLQETIYQFEHAYGVVGRINREEGQGSKSEQLAEALEEAQPIIIVTIQTFPFVLDAIQSRTTLKGRSYAVIADEAHSSQTGKAAVKLKEVLLAEKVENDKELTAEDMINFAIRARAGMGTISYFAFTATPKAKTIELFGRLPNPELPPSKENKPGQFHVYTMRQAIEEQYILDVLKNYTTYDMAYNLAHMNLKKDKEVDRKKGGVKVTQWVNLHPHNISQKVKVVIEHYRENVMHLLGGQAKAMVVTGSRKSAIRYKREFDKYVKESGYDKIKAIVAFSGDVIDKELQEEPFNERNMNPTLKGRDIREAFDSEDFQVLLVANKFQTGFDQPKLCAMYVDKKIEGVDCVQTLSRLNRTYPGKKESGTFILDFVNDPDEVLASFRPYYKTAELNDVSDPNLVYELFDKLNDANIYQWHHVEEFVMAFYNKYVKQDKLTNICKPAKDQWQERYKLACQEQKKAKEMLDRSKKAGDPVLVANAEKEYNEQKKKRGALEIFKKDLATYCRMYNFLSQIINYDDPGLEKLSLFAQHLHPLLELANDDEEIDLSHVQLTHYRLSIIKQQDLELHKEEEEESSGLQPIKSVGSGQFKDKKTEKLSKILHRLSELFAGEATDDDMVNYANTVADKVYENKLVISQIQNNTLEQAMLGDFPNAVNNAVMDSGEIHQSMMMQYLSSPEIRAAFNRIIFDLLTEKRPNLRR